MIYVDINEMIKNASDELKEAIKLDNDFFWDSLNDDQKTAIRIYFREYVYGLDRKVKDNKFSKKDKDEIITRALRYIAWDKRKRAANYCLMGIYKDKNEHISYMLEEAKVLEQEAEKYAKHGIK